VHGSASSFDSRASIAAQADGLKHIFGFQRSVTPPSSHALYATLAGERHILAIDPPERISLAISKVVQ
jgi:hypothetical protein